MKNEDNKKERVVDFIQILQLVANEIFGDVIYDVNFRKSVNQCKAKDLPSNEDVRLLMNGCEEVMKSIDVMDIHSSNFIPVRAATSTYLIIFNARRGGEPLRLLMNQWDEALKREWTDQIPPEEESDLLVTFQTGKGIYHLVPVMFPPCCHKALQYLCNADVRENANVSRENKHLFPSVGQSTNHASGWHSINDMLVRISKKGSLNATKNRHRVASLLANLQLTEKEKDLIFKHFAHSKDVNEEIYQASAGTRQINSIGQMLLEVSFIFFSC